MGFSKKHQPNGSLESEGKKWVIAGIAICAPLRSISTRAEEKECDDNDNERSTTPTTRESRIPKSLRCPPAPRKRRPASTCHYNGVREFFTPPDLESVFVRHVESAN
ncbi:cyclin-dependent protein kinase inhibitor SMR6-like [Cornus florida]|uniref:cyclin-dependent protein kinase inhibitor SMR6-like n=1 Tax=Cornus florida TaxID=4283 RepID=UPI00289821A8|nr:cyclin-dependent protein kinase inhibitor SMR6-like [Cornus florida]